MTRRLLRLKGILFLLPVDEHQISQDGLPLQMLWYA